MEKKKGKSGAGAVLVLLAAVVKLVQDSGRSDFSISLLYLLAIAVIAYGAYWLFKRFGNRPGDKLAGPAGRFPEQRSVFGSSRPRRTAEPERTRPAASPPPDGAARSAEQWKSLYDGGLITKEEYREKLGRISGRG
ncbi:hypothetical protein CAFE_10520 [Caprobacter fermentans]|uniref:SHOCT domain-containing protein n=1 Tax=Caproicibacter fermentans TaxID=2576756 RepID=A0A6N8HWZ5_9FIRM|nr:hypothetical protein [Caproicibacter fermentans]MVB10364.1 hypothetical protein [Caproicibacter fermentans]